MSVDWEAVHGHLCRGGVVAHPTETVYGFAAPVSEEGVGALRALKGRQPDRPFLVLVPDNRRGREWLDELVWTPAARILARRFWPGPVTLILSGPRDRIPPGVRNADGGVAVRVSPHPVAGELLARWDGPLLSTSANRSGDPPAVMAQTVKDSFQGAIDEGSLLVVDGGALEQSPPSTLVDCTGDRPRIVREGAVSMRTLMRELEEIHER
ncbi:MAG: Sua5/YciO/YrdC/YwlC family protein [Gemmatimonadales bacterium]|nr:MAG: Sua5/YciO/YrdC/YwlC family protein [Gemmatimonadales bacterium]